MILVRCVLHRTDRYPDHIGDIFIYLPRHQQLPLDESVLLIAHKIGKLCERTSDLNSCQPILDYIVQRTIHAQKPLISFRFADWEREMAGAQSRVAEALNVKLRAAHPTR